MLTRKWIAAFVLLCLPAPARADDWHAVAPAGQGFKIAFPIRPVENSSQKATLIGPVKVFAYRALTAIGHFEMLHTDFNATSAKLVGLNVEKALDGARQEILKLSGGKLAAEGPIKLGLHSGREFSFTAETKDKKPLVGYARIYFVSPRLYQLQVAGEVGVLKGADVRQFFDSFSIEAK